MAIDRKSTDNVTGRRAAGRPPRHVAQEIDEQLLDAARALFCQKGIAGTSMEEVAEAAGIAKQTIYRRYPGKAALIDEVVSRDLDRLMAKTDAETGSPLERLRAIALQRFHYALEPQNLLFVSFLMAEGLYSPALRERFREWGERLHRPIMELQQNAQAAGELRASDVGVTARLLDDLIASGPDHVRFCDPRAFDGLTSDEWFDVRWETFLRLERA